MPEQFKDKQKKLLNQLIGLGPDSMQKSYYPELMSKVQELKRFRDLLDQISDLILFVELPAGRIFDMNMPAATVLGYTEEELRGMRLSDLFDQRMAEKINEHLFSGRGHGTIMEVDILNKDQETISAQLTCSIARENEEFVGILVVRDMTEAVRTRNALVRQRQYFSQLFTNAPVAIVLMDDKSAILDVNKSFEQMFGYRREELIGGSVDDILTTEEVVEQAREFTRKIEGGEQVEGEGSRRHKDGSMIQVKLRGFPIYMQGKISGVIGLYEDITERKRLEQEMVKSQKLESIALLAGGIAHDFNNLLAGLMANLSLVRFHERENKKVLGLLTKAENACLRARDMTQQLLTFSKGGEPVRSVFYLEEALKQTVEFALSGSNVGYSLDIEEDLWPVMADRGQFNQVIQNLVINADQAMPGGGELIVHAKNKTMHEETAIPLQPGKYVLLTVSDNGVGIRFQDLDKIFDPYFSTKDQGNGLGLAIVFSIVKKHGGWIEVDSAPGKGTVFHVYFPAAENNKIELQPKSDSEEQKWFDAKILFMDDERDLAEVTANLLQEMGYEVVSVPDGETAIQEYEQALSANEKFDVVVMDLTIPGGMGGKETIKKLMKKDPLVQAVASSGYSNDPVMSRFADYGFRAALIKPYKIEELDAVIQKIVGGK